MNAARGGRVRSPSWNTKRLSKDKLREHLDETRLIDELDWARSAGSMEDTVWTVRRKVVAACDHSMPRRRHGYTGDSMFTHSKGDPLLGEAWKKAKSALRQGMKESRIQCWKDLIGEVEKDIWGLAFKIVTKRLVTGREKTPGLGNADQIKYIVRSFFPRVEPFQRQDRSSCVVRREELFTHEELKRAGGRLKAKTPPEIDGVPNEILKEVMGAYPLVREGGFLVLTDMPRNVLGQSVYKIFHHFSSSQQKKKKRKKYQRY